jgi:hypothetical protein
MRYACITLAQGLLEKFLCLAGVESSGMYKKFKKVEILVL